MSIPNYVHKALERIGHIFSGKPEHSPDEHIPIKQGNKVQYTEPDENSPILDSKDIKRIQVIVDIFIYYRIAIDNTMVVTLNDIEAKQSKSTRTKKLDRSSNSLTTLPHNHSPSSNMPATWYYTYTATGLTSQHHKRVVEPVEYTF